MADQPLYTFPAPSSGDPAEWPGTALGISNTITRTKGRTAAHDKTVDATPGLLEKLLASAQKALAEASHRGMMREHDVVIHGIRVRAATNSRHLHDFWVDNWYGVEEWERLTGRKPAAEPQVKVYAVHSVADQPEAAYYSRKSSTIIFFNTCYYGQLKSWVLGAVGRILATEYGIHSIHGACVERNGKGVLYIAPTGTGKSTSSYGLMSYSHTRFHSDDWVYVRYAYPTRDGRRVHIISAQGSDGSSARGYQVYRWIQEHASDEAARLDAVTLGHEKVEVTLGDLDLSQRLEAYAYTSEKIFYLRTNLVENFPAAAYEILASKEENVPDVTSKFLEARHKTLEKILHDLQAAPSGNHRDPFTGKSGGEVERTAARLIAFDNARSMLDITKVLPAERVYTNPMVPVRLAAVILLKRDPEDPTVLEHILLDQFMARLLIGETPEKKRETAYNAYRAVDDKGERAFITALEKQVTPGRSLYSLFSAAPGMPVSLAEEFELFRVMYQAARTYDLNTNLQKDPRVRDKREAVGRTLAIIARVLEEEPHPIRLTLADYSNYINAASARG